MTRWRALGVLGLALAATAGLYAASGSGSAGHVGPGRYRDGRGRDGREGPASNTGPTVSPLLTGLAAYWPMASSSVDVLGGHSGTDTGAGHVVSYAGGAWACSTNNCRTTFAALATGTTFSISVWLMPVSPVGYTDGFGTIIGQDGNNAFFMNNAHPKLYPQASASGSVTAGALTNLVLVANGSVLTYYINGVADPTTPAFTTGLSLTMIGASAGSGSECIAGTAGTGTIKEIGVWTVALSAENVTTLFNSGTPKTYPF